MTTLIFHYVSIYNWVGNKLNSINRHQISTLQLSPTPSHIYVTCTFIHEMYPPKHVSTNFRQESKSLPMPSQFQPSRDWHTGTKISKVIYFRILIFAHQFWYAEVHAPHMRKGLHPIENSMGPLFVRTRLCTYSIIVYFKGRKMQTKGGFKINLRFI